jgi:hypothetical protein
MPLLANNNFTCHVKASPKPLIKEEENDFSIA